MHTMHFFLFTDCVCLANSFLYLFIHLLGLQAIQLVVDHGRRIMSSCPLSEQLAVQKLCSDTESLSRQLAEMVRHGQVRIYFIYFKLNQNMYTYYY